MTDNRRRGVASAQLQEARRRKRYRQVMRNRIIFALVCFLLLLLIVFAIVKLLTRGGSASSSADTSTLTFAEDGSIVFEEVTDFDSDSYDKKELQSQSEDLIASFNETYGSDAITLEQLTVKNDSAYMKTSYQDADVYTSFTSYNTYFDSVANAVEAGYDFADTFATVTDGVAGDAIETDGASEFLDYQVAIVEQNVAVTVPGQILYVSSSGARLLSEDTVSITADADNPDVTERVYIIYTPSSAE